MKTVVVTPEDEDLDRIGDRARSWHALNVIPPDTTLVTPDGTKLVVFGKLKEDFSDVKAFCREVKYGCNSRLTQKNNDYAQKRSSYATFGFKPKRPVFGHAASSCAFNADYPAWYKRLGELALCLEEEYRVHGPEIYARQRESIETKVRTEWRIPGTIFTQGIINDSNALDYHLDKGNFHNFWSCMAVFSQGVSGGRLVIPSLGAALDVQDGTYVLFNGQKHVHGVSPIRSGCTDAFRYSIVFYAQAIMQNAGSYDDEIAEARKFDLTRHKKKGLKT